MLAAAAIIVSLDLFVLLIFLPAYQVIFGSRDTIVYKIGTVQLIVRFISFKMARSTLLLSSVS
jgi:hypothetical protein